MGRREEEDKAVLSPGGDDTADLSLDDSPWSDNAWSEDEDDDESSLSFEDSGEGSDADSDGLDDEDDAAAEESDSSEDEVGPRNTVGDVLLEWYKDEEHIGYDILGRKIKKRDMDGKIERFLSSKDNDDDWYEAPTRLAGI